MFDRLAAYIASMSIMSIAGVVIIAGLAMGYVEWPLFLVAALVGLLGLPLAIYMSRLIRRNDPEWPEDRPAGGSLF